MGLGYYIADMNLVSFLFRSHADDDAPFFLVVVRFYISLKMERKMLIQASSVLGV